MKKTTKPLLDLILRYAILVLIALPNFWLFYFIFTPLTIYPLYFLFTIFFDVFVQGNMLLIAKNFLIQLIPACVAGAAYYLLLILNLSVPNIKLKKRIKMILFAFISFLIINIIRIFFLSLLILSDSGFFNLAHKIFWYALSTLFVIGIWFLEVKIFNIKEIPIYSDLKFLYKQRK